jgi:DNA polymerase I-like protein with 3'-5' exonuclease and polymerase domains
MVVLRFAWEHHTITTNAEAEQMRQLFRTTTPYIAGFDTETNGLNIVRCKPFLYQFGWIDKTTMKGYTFAVDLELYPMLSRQVIKVWHALVKNVWKYFGHNVKFDLHMITNIDLPYSEPNISDTMAWMRSGTDAVSVRKGGDNLKLKDFAVKHIDHNAKDHERLLDEERSAIAKALNIKLRQRLGWKQKQINTFFNDTLNDVDDLPEAVRASYIAWHENDLPEYLRPVVTGSVDSEMIGYNTLNRKNVTKYGHFDIVWTLEAADMLIDTVTLRGNLDAVARDESNIYPVYEMERTGFKADKEYLYECKAKVKNYIRIRRQDMYSIAGRVFNISQHDVGAVPFL